MTHYHGIDRRRTSSGEKLPKEIYASVVDSLYADRISMSIGMGCLVLASVVAYLVYGDPFQLVFAGTFGAAGMGRYALSKAYAKQSSDTFEVPTLRRWEVWYLLSSTAYIALMGSWFMYCLWFGGSAFLQLLSLALGLGYLTGIIGRNFASAKVVIWQTAVSGILMTGGVVVFGPSYHVLLALFLVPFFVALFSMSRRLRGMLHTAEKSAIENKEIVNRFELALANIDHGIAMFSKEGHFLVANGRFKDITGLHDWRLTEASTSILSAVAIRGAAARDMGAVVTDCLAAGHARSFDFTTGAGKSIAASYTPMPNGGVMILSDISDRMNAQEAIRILAEYDPLTCLYNRRKLEDEGERQLTGRDGKLGHCAMFFLDLDRFKEVNDTLGHSVGDELLCKVAKRLLSVIPDNALACRFGGDEFIVVLPGKMSDGDAEGFCKTLVDAVSRPYDFSTHNVSTTCSVGVAFGGKDAFSFSELLKISDAALYRAKSQGNSSFCFYTEELAVELRERMKLEEDLKSAIKNGEIELFFQPLLNVGKGGINTCEALARWRHPERGFISPGTFIPIAEETGLILSLGEHVFDLAVAECAKWPEDVRVAVNVSPIQMQHADVRSIIAEVLDRYGVDPHRLEVELTETALVQDIEKAGDVLRSLKELGVRIALDDFGTGFSSLSYLHALPFDKIKIDQAFVQNGLEDARSLTLLKGIVDLAKRLGLDVVLEGVETEAQMESLSRSVAVNEVQGYLFARPMPAKDIADFLLATNPSHKISNIRSLTG